MGLAALIISVIALVGLVATWVLNGPWCITQRRSHRWQTTRWVPLVLQVVARSDQVLTQSAPETLKNGPIFVNKYVLARACRHRRVPALAVLPWRQDYSHRQMLALSGSTSRCC